MSILEYSENFVRHLKSPPKNAHHCKLCPFFTTSTFLMVNHVKQHSSPSLSHFNCQSVNIETYWCKDCNFQSELTFIFKQHIIQRHNKNEDSPIKNFVVHHQICDECDFGTHFSMKWLQHRLFCFGNNKHLKKLDDVKWFQ